MEQKPAAKIWGPKYWFFLDTIANLYPDYPNETIKRKYYDLIMNFPTFIPNQKMGNRFSEMLDEFPIQPYLKSKDSLLKWMYFMHNKYNNMLKKDSPISFERSQEEFLSQFDKKETTLSTESFPEAWIRRNKNMSILFILAVLAILLVYTSI